MGGRQLTEGWYWEGDRAVLGGGGGGCNVIRRCVIIMRLINNSVVFFIKSLNISLRSCIIDHDPYQATVLDFPFF